MNRPRVSGFALVGGCLASLLVYLVAGAVLVTLVQRGFPGEVDAQGRAVGPHVLTLDLVAQAIATFAAGAVALPFVRGRWALATAVMGGVLLLVLAAATWSMWDLAPAWVNLLGLVTTLPFFALGAAFRSAGARTVAP
jgi:hypothetical protein